MPYLMEPNADFIEATWDSLNAIKDTWKPIVIEDMQYCICAYYHMKDIKTPPVEKVPELVSDLIEGISKDGIRTDESIGVWQIIQAHHKKYSMKRKEYE